MVKAKMGKTEGRSGGDSDSSAHLERWEYGNPEEVFARSKHSRATAAGMNRHFISRKTASYGNWLNTAGKDVNTAGVARHINIRSMTNEIQQPAARPEMGL